jgi:hypothetical protein
LTCIFIGRVGFIPELSWDGDVENAPLAITF